MNEEDEYKKEYLGVFQPPQNLLEWVEDFIIQLECPPPIPYDNIEFFRRDGAWNTQQLILQKLKYALKQEKLRLMK